jgi:hypothetical protein
MHGPVRAGFDKLRQFRLLLRREARRLALRPAIFQTIRPMLVKAMDPVAQRLAIHAADPRRIGPVHAVQDRCERQKTPALVRVRRRCCKPPQLFSRKIRPQFHR